MTGFLVLEDGTVFAGESVGARSKALGEAVFTTGMSGYQEVVTDPSFSGQLVCFTAPMVGNYGVADHRSESDAPHARGVLMREARGPAVDGLARGARPSGALGHRHALAHAPSARARRAPGSARRRRHRSRRGTRARPQPALDGGAGARRPRLDAVAVPVLLGRRSRRGRRLRHEALDPAPPRRGRRRRHGVPARRGRRHARRLRRRRALERPRGSRAARRTRSRSCTS